MANVIDYIDVYNGQPTAGLSRGALQKIFGFAYVSDGAGSPAPDGTTVYSREWFIDRWSNSPSPCTLVSLGTSFDGGRTFQTFNGFAPMTSLAETPGIIAHWGFFMDLADDTGTGPNFDFSSDCTSGSTIDPAVFSSPPTVTGVPGDGQILWTWTPAVLLDSRVPIAYALSWGTSTPSAHPAGTVSFGVTSHLSTGLTNGVTYNARVEAYACMGGTAVGNLFSSTRDSTSPRGPTGGDGLSALASAVPAVSTMVEQWGAIAV